MVSRLAGRTAVAAEPVSGVEIFVPLAKLKKSPRNARKVPHGEAAIEALAASIQHKGLIQNLVVEPETKEDGTPTGYYLVTAGEGRRLAMLLRAKRKQIRKSDPVRCWLDTANDPSEISLDENVTRMLVVEGGDGRERRVDRILGREDRLVPFDRVDEAPAPRAVALDQPGMAAAAVEFVIINSAIRRLVAEGQTGLMQTADMRHGDSVIEHIQMAGGSRSGA